MAGVAGMAHSAQQRAFWNQHTDRAGSRCERRAGCATVVDVLIEARDEQAVTSRDARTSCVEQATTSRPVTSK